MRKEAIGSKAGHGKTSTQEVFPTLRPHQSHPQEEVAEEKEKEIGEEAKVDEEDGEKNIEEEPANPNSSRQEDPEDEAIYASPSQQHDKAVEANEDKKKRARRGSKRKRTAKKKPAPRAKKARTTKPQEEPEYFEEKRILQDLWRAAFPVGTGWKMLDALYEHDWDFKHLEEALEEGGMLYGKKVFVFVNAEPQFVLYKGVNKIVPVPTVVVIESPFPPSDEIAIPSTDGAVEEIIPMKQMKLDWVPYIPFDKRERQIDRMKFQIFIMVCTQRSAALRHLKEECVRKYDYCLPYFFDPFEEDELEQSTRVEILFPSEPPVFCEFDWNFDRLEIFVDRLIEDGELSAEQKDEFKQFVNDHVGAARRATEEAVAARMEAIEEMSEDAIQAFLSMNFYKFYPRPSPDISGLQKSPTINRYYGDAHQVL